MAQPKLEFSLKKPQQYENRKLGSEKMAEKRFTFLRHFFQNNFTRFNYYFNANLKLNEIINDATIQTKDDFTKLLSFYPYSLDNTSKSIFLDSIIQKCTAGILLHDLRNDWIDNLYLVMGKAYLLRKNFDSAAMTFQYINFTFAPKEKDGYDKLIGSNAEEGTNAFTIATREKDKFFSYLVTRPPSRNEAFVWQVRTLTENGDYTDASSLIETLKNDPHFPERLKEEMAEARAYLYYKMEWWDSSANYLEKAIPLASGRQEKARAWFLAGQLYQLANNYQKASDAFSNCTDLALDPVMEVYARLNSIRLNKGDDPKIIDDNIAKLVSMAKKDRYHRYRAIIYYAAALFELERNGYAQATAFLQESVQNKNEQANENQQSISYMLLGDIEYAQKNYASASVYYDSVEAESLSKEAAGKLETRKPGTRQIYEAVQVINLQDSLLHLASLDENERAAMVKQVSKKLRKAKGLKDDPSDYTGSAPVQSLNASSSGSDASSLFAQSSGNWYFYDPGIRGNGYNKFRERWGARPNVDNWRRIAAIQVNNLNAGKVDDDDKPIVIKATGDDQFDSTDVSFDNLYSRIPLSEERKETAKARKAAAFYSEGVALHEMLEDYPEAIKVFENLLTLRDSGILAEKALFALVHCYSQVGDMANANRCKNLLNLRFGGGNLASNAGAPLPPGEANPTATNLYHNVYNLFIEGNFEKALEEKRLADSALGKNYWTPQLLYIESVYHIRQREDSVAIGMLNNLVKEFPTHPLAARAKTMSEVLGRRKEIEAYLTRLEITRAREDEVVTTIARPVVSPATNPVPMNTAAVKTTGIQPVKDSAAGLVTAIPTQVSPYVINPLEPCMVAIVLEKVDPAYVNEVLYALSHSNQKNFNGQSFEASKLKLKENLWLVTLRSASITNAESAVNYISYIKPLAQKNIISWLEPSKYQFILLSENNLNLLQQDPNLSLYQKVLRETFPGKF